MLHILQQNSETIDRLVVQGELFLNTCRAEQEKAPASCQAEFLRGNFAGWRSTLHTLYGDCAEEIVDRVLVKTCLPIPEGEIRSGIAPAF